MTTNVTIKRQKFCTYNETDIICTESGKEIARQQNLNVRNRYGAKEYKYNGQILTVKEWQRVIQNQSKFRRKEKIN